MEIPEVVCARFHESSNRSHLLLGCEPSAIAASVLFSVLIGMGLRSLYGWAGALVLFLFLRHGFRILAKEDPNMLTVYQEAQRYNQGAWTAKPIRAQKWRTR